MTFTTFIATAVLVYVAVAAFAYHEAYERRVEPGPSVAGPEFTERRLVADLLRFTIAGALITCGVVLVIQTVASQTGRSLTLPLTGHWIADWILGVALAVSGAGILRSVRGPIRHRRSRHVR